MADDGSGIPVTRHTRCGLVLGKFAPFHAGHQLLVETAMAECDGNVVVIIYDAPDTIDTPLSIRAGWVRDLYPPPPTGSGHVHVIEAWDGPTVVGATPAIQAMHERYILALLREHGYDDTPLPPAASARDTGGVVIGQVNVRRDGGRPRRVTHFYSSEFYGEHVSAALGAVDRRVDTDRVARPISGTACRADPSAAFAAGLLHPRVHADLIMRVAFVGAESTGKSTLTAACAAALGTSFAPEYGREFWERHHDESGMLTADQLVELAVGHRQREDEALRVAKCGVLFVDTNAITTLLYSCDYHGCALPQLAAMASECGTRYDLTVLCGDGIAYDDTADRRGDRARKIVTKKTRAWLQAHAIPFIEVDGSVEERVATVLSLVKRMRKWRGVVEAATGWVVK